MREFADRIGTVAIEDMKRGSHIHLPFGEGDMDVPGVLEALEAVGFGKLICVELSRESHRADVMISAGAGLPPRLPAPRPGPGGRAGDAAAMAVRAESRRGEESRHGREGAPRRLSRSQCEGAVR